MTVPEIEAAFDIGRLVWNDPDKIEGNDYLVSTLAIEPAEENPDVAFIMYNNDSSDATVPLHELGTFEDMFEKPESIPADVQKVLDTLDEDADQYRELARLVGELEKIGYTFSYYLDAVPFNLRKI